MSAPTGPKSHDEFTHDVKEFCSNAGALLLLLGTVAFFLWIVWKLLTAPWHGWHGDTRDVLIVLLVIMALGGGCKCGE